MRMILATLFATATCLLNSQPSNGQMLLPGQITPEKYKNCFIYRLREIDRVPVDELLETTCQSPKGWVPTVHDPIFSFPAINALYNAESAYCGSPGCTTTGKDMRVVLVGDTLPRARTYSNRTDTAVTIVVTTALVDFVQRNAHSLMNDLFESPEMAAEGFKAWLEGVRAQGGKPCSLPLKWNTTKVFPRYTQEHLMRATMTTYTILFAHELAHLRSNRTCGYQADSKLSPEMNALGVEKACDNMAFKQLSKAGIAMPLFAAATFVGWQHYITLKKPKLISEYPGGLSAFKQDFPALSLTDRAQALIDEWERVCRGGTQLPMCFAHWEDAVAEGKKIIKSPVPTECTP